MNPDQLRAAFENNKPVVVGGALAGVVGLALWRKKNGGGQADAGAALSAGSQTAAASGGAAYDSSASDLYGAIQPQLEAIGQQLSQLQNPKPSTIPAPKPAPKTVHVDPQPKTLPKPGPKPPTPKTTIPRPAPKPKPVAHHAAPSPLTYTVKPGDSLSKIAARYPSKSITWGTIYKANKATIGGNPNAIKPGQKLVIK